MSKTPKVMCACCKNVFAAEDAPTDKLLAWEQTRVLNQKLEEKHGSGDTPTGKLLAWQQAEVVEQTTEEPKMMPRKRMPRRYRRPVNARRRHIKKKYSPKRQLRRKAKRTC